MVDFDGKTKVSIVIPVYNAKDYLQKCLDSVLNQTLKDIEIIIIDDGSTDGSSEISKSYLSDSRVTYYYKQNEGLAAARQDGMERAHGEYIGFVDSDDWIESEMYEKMYNASKVNNADIVFCNWIENEDGNKYPPAFRSGAFNREEIVSEILPRTLAYISDRGGKRVYRWSNCLRIYKRKLLLDNNICFDRRFRRSQDLQLTYEATLYAQNYYHLGEEYLYHNRTTKGSLSRGYTENMWPLYVPLIERLYMDTELFPELNLMEQMHLRNFFWVTDCIENELKSESPYKNKKRIELITEIVNHPLCERYYGHVDYNRLNSLYKNYYELIHKKDVKGIIAFTKRYKRKKKKSFYSSTIHFITEGPIIGKMYKMIRFKE